MGYCGGRSLSCLFSSTVNCTLLFLNIRCIVLPLFSGQNVSSYKILLIKRSRFSIESSDLIFCTFQKNFQVKLEAKKIFMIHTHRK